MATPRRRSARLRKSATPERSPLKKSVVENKLGSLLERDETSEAGAQAQPSLDTLLSTPNAPPDTILRDRLAQLSAMKTPSSVPHPSNAEMHPEHNYQSTARSPDSGLRLGFTSIDNHEKSLAEAQNTPTKTGSPPGIPEHLKSPGFEFKFAAENSLSSEAQKLMANVRQEAARIKEQMRLEYVEQEGEDPEDVFTTINAQGRKIAKPKGKVGRFSDVHMADFKKMDSIANHASAFRARPGYLQPTTMSLKRKGSKADLDEQERPRTAGKTLSQVKASTTPRRRQLFHSPSKPVVAPATVGRIDHSPAKRPRLQKVEQVSANMSAPAKRGAALRPISQPRSGFGFPSNLFTPTKASLARSATVKETGSAQTKVSMLPKSASMKSLNSPNPNNVPSSDTAKSSDTAISAPITKGMDSSKRDKSHETDMATPKTADKPLPPVPAQTQSTSKLPKFSGLKGILRRHQPQYSNDPIKIAAGTHVAYPSGSSKINEHLSNLSSDGVGTPDRRMTLGNSTPSIKKRVEFTPSTKSRHRLAVAVSSPSKSTIADVEKRQGTPFAPPSLFDASAYLLNDDVHYPQLNLDSSSEPPSSPVPPIAQPVRQVRQQDILDRDSPHFKSIFMTLHPRPVAHSTEPKTAAEKARSPSSSPFKPSPSTIRQVRPSGVGVQPTVQPFEDLQTVPHGIPGKKRRRESSDDTATQSDVKYNRRQSIMPSVPGSFPHESPKDESSDAPTIKRRKLFSPRSDRSEHEASSMKENVQPKPSATDAASAKLLMSPAKKPNAARMAAASAAKERKTGGKGFLTMARLNALSRPKERK